MMGNNKVSDYLEVDEKTVKKLIEKREPKRKSKYPPTLRLKELKPYKLKRVGVIREVDLVGRDGEPYVGKVCDVSNLVDNETYGLWLNKIILDKFEKHDIKEGDVFVLIFKGIVPMSSDRYYKDYAIYKWDKDLEKQLEEKWIIRWAKEKRVQKGYLTQLDKTALNVENRDLKNALGLETTVLRIPYKKR